MKAKSENRLIERSKVGISHSAPRNEMGTPRLTQAARRKRRKRARLATTSRNPCSPLRVSSSRRSRSTFVWSRQVLIWTPSGSQAWASLA